MMNKDSLKHIQIEPKVIKPMKSEYQTVRLFAILGAMTLALVLFIRFVQNDTHSSAVRQPTSSVGNLVGIATEPSKK